jgi:hypothetical protein
VASTSSTIQIVIDGVTDGLRGAAVDAAQSLGRVQRETENADRSMSRMAVSAVKAFTGLGSFAGAVPVVAGLAASVGTAAGALLVLPGAAVAGGAALGTLKLATAGFGDAVKAADPKEFTEATKNMAPAAVATAKAVRDMQPAFRDLKKEVQGQFFAGFADDARLLGATYLPILRTGLAGIATEYNAMGREATKALLAPANIAAVNTVLTGTKNVLGDMRPALGNVLTGILQVGAGGTREFNNVGLAITAATEKFKNWATEANQSGRISELIRNGREEFEKWGQVAANVGAIVSTIFEGLGGSQVDFVDGMIQATTAVRTFLASTAGQNGLQALGQILQTTATVTREVFLTALQAIAPVIAAAAPAIQQMATIIGGMLVTAIRIVGPPLQALGEFLASNVGVVQVLTPLLIGLVVAFKGLSILGSLVLPLAATVIAMNAVGLATGRLTTALRILTLATGPIGILLGGAAIALGIFAAANTGSSEAVQENQQAIEGIKGTLNQYTGAVTQATQAQVASELSARTLADGTTKFSDAVAAAGISFSDFTAAAAGNEEALQGVNRQLLDAGVAFIQNEANLGRWGKTIADAKVPTETLALAVIGNEQAVKSLSEQYGISESVVQSMIAALRAQSGSLFEVGAALGTYTANVKAAQEQTQAAADAAREFGTVLGAIKDGLAGLAGGNAPLAAMVAEFNNLADAATRSATEAGNSAEKFGGVEAGARKAGQAMQESRDSFIQAAEAAGNTKEQAGLLADQIGLIPAVASVAFATNADETVTDLLALNVQIERVPPGKAVKIEALTDAAVTQLRDLGFTVEQLPNGEFEVTADTNKAKQSLADVVAEVGRSQGTITVDANTAPADTKIRGAVTLADGSKGTMTLDANPNPATGKVEGVVTLANGSKGTITLDGNRDPATGKINATITYANGSTGTVQVQANTGSAQSAIDRLKVPTQSTHTIRVIQQIANRSFGSAGFAQGAIALPMAGGGTLSPMSGRVATVVPANTWRVIGDNMTVPEAFIPLNGSRRSMKILEDAAARMGRAVVPLAGGGVTTASVGSDSVAPEVRVYIGDRELTDMVRVEIGRSNRQLNRTVSAGAGLNR